jgi:hypothetical protein
MMKRRTGSLWPAVILHWALVVVWQTWLGGVSALAARSPTDPCSSITKLGSPSGHGATGRALFEGAALAVTAVLARAGPH